jgi:hypothetical protein
MIYWQSPQRPSHANLSFLRFQTYFPHVDNVYSHRSTQKYKRKPFISHYWDCRLKGRPAGTPKSDDPNKKKRKRIARERDLCDVKIKITEYLPGATREDIATHLSQQPKNDGVSAENLLATVQATIARNDTWDNNNALFGGNFIQTNVRFYTVQRVNGTGPNGKEEGAGGHRHTLEESDRIKKNSVFRWLQKNDKGEKPAPSTRKKVAVSQSFSLIKLSLSMPGVQQERHGMNAGLLLHAYRHSSQVELLRHIIFAFFIDVLSSSIEKISDFPRKSNRTPLLVAVQIRVYPLFCFSFSSSSILIYHYDIY